MNLTQSELYKTQSSNRSGGNSRPGTAGESMGRPGTAASVNFLRTDVDKLSQQYETTINFSKD
jgi:hypothetical protein